MNRSLNIQLLPFLKGISMKRGAIFGGILVMALVSFEISNYGITSYTLRDILGDLQFGGIYWASILAFAFCGIDFAGIARIFTPEQGREEPAEIWYLFGAWLLGAGFNAALTWWGVSVAIVNHSSAAAGTVVSSATLTKVIPIFVAVMIWLIRVLIIGTFSLAGDRLFSTASNYAPRPYQPASAQPSGLRPASSFARPAPKPMTQSSFSSARPEPTYHPLGFDTPNQQRES